MKEQTMFLDGFGDAELERFLDASYILDPKEIESIDRMVYSVVRHAEIAQKHFPTIQLPPGSKERHFYVEQEQDPPLFTDDFLAEDLDEVKKKVGKFYPIYMHKDFALTKVDIDASRSKNMFNIDAKRLTVRGSTASIVMYRERSIWRGYDIMGRSAANAQGSIDTNSKGILNADPFAVGSAQIKTFEAGAGADDDIQAVGDGVASIGLAVNSLLATKYVGPYNFFMTPLVKAQLILNMNSTTHITDLERMQSMIDEKGNKILKSMDTSAYLINAAELTSTGAMVLIDPKTPMNEPTVGIGEVYPVTHYPTTQNPLYIKGKVIWAGCALVLDPNAVTLAESIDT